MLEDSSTLKTTRKISLCVLALAMMISTSGCAKQISDFVDKARVDDVPIPKMNLKDDAAPKISPARIMSSGTTTRMEANFTATNRELKGTTLRASITTSRTSNE
jgi:hypothetical protein